MIEQFYLLFLYLQQAAHYFFLVSFIKGLISFDPLYQPEVSLDRGRHVHQCPGHYRLVVEAEFETATAHKETLEDQVEPLEAGLGVH